ncbi:MAG: hypothetical protein P4N24_16720 [Acidobacteriota bacterium]|nr:hypothetical protein [Acidobacteriota bacterium]
MRPRIVYLLAVGLLLLAALAVAGNQTPVRPGPYLHPKVKAKEIKIQKVVALPPIVSMTKQGVKGSEGMSKEEDEASVGFASRVSADLTSSGLSVEAPFTEEALKGNDELKYALADVQKKYDELAPKLYRKPKDVRKARFSLGDMVAVLNSKGTADALVIVRSQGVKMTKGKGMLTGGLIGLATTKNPTFTTYVVIVDAKNGDVLYLDEFLTSGIPKDKVFDKSFKKFVAPK